MGVVKGLSLVSVDDAVDVGDDEIGGPVAAVPAEILVAAAAALLGDWCSPSAVGAERRLRHALDYARYLPLVAPATNVATL